MRAGVDRPLHDRHHLRHRFRCPGRQQLASAPDVDPRSHLWGCHSHCAIFHHAAFVRTRICGIKDTKPSAGKTSQLDEPCRVRHRSLPFRDVCQPVAIRQVLTKVRQALVSGYRVPFYQIKFSICWQASFRYYECQVQQGTELLNEQAESRGNLCSLLLIISANNINVAFGD